MLINLSEPYHVTSAQQGEIMLKLVLRWSVGIPVVVGDK